MGDPIVPTRITLPSGSQIYTARTIRGPQHAPVGSAANYLLGKGATLIGAHATCETIATGATATYRYKVWRQYQTLTRLWCIRLRRNTGIEADPSVAIETPAGGTAVEYDVNAIDRLRTQTIMHFESVTQGAGIADASIAIENLGALTALNVEQIACYALPRTVLAADGNENGVDVNTLRATHPIYDAANEGFGGEVDSVVAVRTVARRCGLFHWATNDDVADAHSTASGSDDDFFDGYPIVLARKLNASSTTGTVQVYVRCRTSAAGTTGTFTLTAASGATATINVPTNSDSAWAWLNTTIAMDAEDLTADDGRRSTRWDELQIEWLRGVTGTLYCSGISIGEA